MKNLKNEKMPNYTQKIQEKDKTDEELDEIIKMLKIVECKLQKKLYKAKKEQTECKSECSKQKIKLIKRNLEVLQNVCNGLI